MHNIPGWDPRNGRAERPSLKFVNEEELERRGAVEKFGVARARPSIPIFILSSAFLRGQDDE